MAALTIATILMYHQVQLDLFKYLALGLLIVLSGIVIVLGFMTLAAIKNKMICIED
jgi:tellurite resistance protein